MFGVSERLLLLGILGFIVGMLRLLAGTLH